MLSRPTAFSVMTVIGLAMAFLTVNEASAFQSISLMSNPMNQAVDAGRIGLKVGGQFRHTKRKNSLRFASPSDEESESVQRLFDYDSNNFESKINEEELEEIEMGQPPEWMVMQQVKSPFLLPCMLDDLYESGHNLV